MSINSDFTRLDSKENSHKIWEHVGNMFFRQDEKSDIHFVTAIDFTSEKYGKFLFPQGHTLYLKLSIEKYIELVHPMGDKFSDTFTEFIRTKSKKISLEELKTLMDKDCNEISTFTVDQIAEDMKSTMISLRNKTNIELMKLFLLTKVLNKKE